MKNHLDHQLLNKPKEQEGYWGVLTQDLAIYQGTQLSTLSCLLLP